MGTSKLSRQPLLVVALALAVALAVSILALAGPLAGVAAEPGSKDDPLATVGYVERFAQFNRVDLPAGQSLRVGEGTEFVIVDAEASTLATNEFDPLRDELLDLSQGAPVLVAELAVYHHYLNASTHDLFLRFDGAAALLIRGAWK